MNYYEEIKQELVNNEISRKVKKYSINKSDLDTYYKVGKMLSEAGGHYGDGIIKKYSRKLTSEISKKYDVSTLKRIRQFYWLIQKGATLSHQLSYSHYVELLPYEDMNKIQYYINIVERYNLSVRQLRMKIKSNEYERLPEKTKDSLFNNCKLNVIDFVKNPIMIKNVKGYEMVSEKVLNKLILEDIENFMRELGNSFCFIGSEYKIKIGNNFNFIDLLLYNIEFNCYVVVELKVTELKKEHIGQIQVYMNYIDENIRNYNQGKTIGIIICKLDNKYLIRYCSDSRIIFRTYKLI